MPQLVGINRAKELSYTGRYLSAEEAHRIGLVNHVFNPDELISETIKLAKRIAISDPIALPKIKKMINDGAKMTLDAALQMEGEAASHYNNALDFSYLEQRLIELRQLATGK